ncbi:MAG: peptidylprolyl isomerase [Anaerolineaceae bacterium]|nr:MAG: peptidylprolyl isomerase [Anaerolineaceae bacterium]
MADEQDLVVADGQMVTLAYILRLDNGEVFDKSEGQTPLEFVQGRGQIIHGLERALYGMHIGEEKEIVVNPADGYGEYDKDDLSVAPRKSLPEDFELYVGKGLRFRDKDNGEVYVGYVAEFDDDKALIDFNHPLAGETLHFQVRIVDLRKATAEEVI